jgi:glycosidase
MENNIMLREAIYHRPWGSYAYLLNSDTLSISLRAKKNDLKTCYLFHGDPWEPDVPLEKLKMDKVAGDDLFDYFKVVLNVPSSRRFRYAFLLDEGSEQLWYTEAGFSSKPPEPKELGLPFFEFLYIRENDAFVVPQWAKEAVFYQIFPERFCNGDKTNDPVGVVQWEALPATHETFYGGDLLGIIEKLPYLNDLGINAIYLTPIFSSPSTHKYDTTDYYQIDPHFGDLATFKRLVQKCHERRIKVILDGVFDHCGFEFWAFQDVLKKGSGSKYKDWFKIYSFPIKAQPEANYETWGKNVWRLPRLITSNSEVKKHLIDVAVYWIKEADIDGWRLDTASEVDHDFWRDFRKAVKAVKPEALIIGEIPHDASPWLNGDQLDSVMNYPFRDIVLDFFAKGRIRAEEFDARLAKLRMQYRQQVNEVLYNLFGSHDTVRFLSLCDNKVDKMMCALIFQMTYIGMPVIYYGDEIGMTSDKTNSDDSRRPMTWDETNQNQRLLSFHKKLVSIRKKHQALTCGDSITVHVDSKSNTYAYLRWLRNERVLVALNNSPQTQNILIQNEKIGIAPELVLIDLLNESKYRATDEKIQLSLPPYAGVILSNPNIS